MKNISRKVQYIRGLADGLEIKGDKRNVTVLEILEVLDMMSQSIEDMESTIKDNQKQISLLMKKVFLNSCSCDSSEDSKKSEFDFEEREDFSRDEFMDEENNVESDFLENEKEDSETVDFEKKKSPKSYSHSLEYTDEKYFAEDSENIGLKSSEFENYLSNDIENDLDVDDSEEEDMLHGFKKANDDNDLRNSMFGEEANDDFNISQDFDWNKAEFDIDNKRIYEDDDIEERNSFNSFDERNDYLKSSQDYRSEIPEASKKPVFHHDDELDYRKNHVSGKTERKNRAFLDEETEARSNKVRNFKADEDKGKMKAFNIDDESDYLLNNDESDFVISKPSKEAKRRVNVNSLKGREVVKSEEQGTRSSKIVDFNSVPKRSESLALDEDMEFENEKRGRENIHVSKRNSIDDEFDSEELPLGDWNSMDMDDDSWVIRKSNTREDNHDRSKKSDDSDFYERKYEDFSVTEHEQNINMKNEDFNYGEVVEKFDNPLENDFDNPLDNDFDNPLENDFYGPMEEDFNSHFEEDFDNSLEMEDKYLESKYSDEFRNEYNRSFDREPISNSKYSQVQNYSKAQDKKLTEREVFSPKEEDQDFNLSNSSFEESFEKSQRSVFKNPLKKSSDSDNIEQAIHSRELSSEKKIRVEHSPANHDRDMVSPNVVKNFDFLEYSKFLSKNKK